MLFRPEVIRNHRSARLVGIAISQSLGAWLLTLAAAGMAAVIVAFLLLGSYTRRASVAGQLVPLQGVVTLPAPVTGIVERLDAAEGDAASAEQTLAIIQAPRAMPESGNGGVALEQQIRQQKASLKAAQDAQQQQLRQQASGLNEQLQAARRELLQIEAEAATRQRQTRLAREKLARYQSLEKAGAASAVSACKSSNPPFSSTKRKRKPCCGKPPAPAACSPSWNRPCASCPASAPPAPITRVTWRNWSRAKCRCAWTTAWPSLRP